MDKFIIRPAREEDLPELLDIYNYEVLNGTATFDIMPWSLDQRKGWLDAHIHAHRCQDGSYVVDESDVTELTGNNHPAYVADIDGKAVGYITLSSYREKEAYAGTVELSVYVDRNHRGLGIAYGLMEFIIEWARKSGLIHSIVSVITEGNADSVALHKSFGFTHCGTMKELGFKNGRYLDIENYQLVINAGEK